MSGGQGTLYFMGWLAGGGLGTYLYSQSPPAQGSAVSKTNNFRKAMLIGGWLPCPPLNIILALVYWAIYKGAAS